MTSPQAKRQYAMTELKAHEQWGEFGGRCPRAASILHFLVSRAGRYGSVTTSHAVLADLCSTSTRTVKRAIKTLEDEQWLQVVRLGSERGGVNCYLLDQGVCWADAREKMAYVDIQTRVLAAPNEQSEKSLNHDGSLKSLPAIAPGEIPVPSGEGMEPPAQPSLEGLEPVVYRDNKGNYYELDQRTGELQQRIGDPHDDQ